LFGSARRKASKADEDVELEHGRLLPDACLAAGDADVQCVSHDSEVLVSREGSSPRMRWHRGRSTLP
jgi:hypothetical protein